MKKAKVILLVATLGVAQLISGCGSNTQSGEEAIENVSVNDTKVEEENTTADVTDTPQNTENSQVASSEEMAEVENVVEEGMTPVYATELKEGVYPVTVDSSSSMFHITSGELRVEGGAMTAVLTMSGTGYL